MNIERPIFDLHGMSRSSSTPGSRHCHARRDVRGPRIRSRTQVLDAAAWRDAVDRSDAGLHEARAQTVAVRGRSLGHVHDGRVATARGVLDSARDQRGLAAAPPMAREHPGEPEPDDPSRLVGRPAAHRGGTVVREVVTPAPAAHHARAQLLRGPRPAEAPPAATRPKSRRSSALTRRTGRSDAGATNGARRLRTSSTERYSMTKRWPASHCSTERTRAGCPAGASIDRRLAPGTRRRHRRSPPRWARRDGRPRGSD